MSSKQLFNNYLIKTPNRIDLKLDHSETNISSRVNINHLLLKVREEKKKQKKENLILLSLVSSVVVITGIVASL
jgi:hypothetical protein